MHILLQFHEAMTSSTAMVFPGLDVLYVYLVLLLLVLTLIWLAVSMYIDTQVQCRIAEEGMISSNEHQELLNDFVKDAYKRTENTNRKKYNLGIVEGERIASVAAKEKESKLIAEYEQLAESNKHELAVYRITETLIDDTGFEYSHHKSRAEAIAHSIK